MVNLFLNEELIESFHFPITDVGESSTVSVIVQNPLADKVELIPFSNDPDVDVVDWPRHLKPLLALARISEARAMAAADR